MRRTGRLIQWTLGLLLTAYVCCLMLLHILWRTPLIEVWWIELLNVFGLWLYLPLPFALLLAPLVRPRGAAWLVLVPLLAFGWEYRSLFTSEQQTADGRTLRVMTWNVFHDNLDVHAIARTLDAHKPDVVALQELNDLHVEGLGPLLEHDYPYNALYPSPVNGRADGFGVWSRFPISEAEDVALRREGCSCQRLVLDVDGEKIRLVNVHPETPHRAWRRLRLLPNTRRVPVPRGFDTTRQAVAFEALVSEAASTELPLIMTGDFNTSDRQPNYWRLRRYLDDAYRAAGSGFGLTFPNADFSIRGLPVPPLLRIDHILHSQSIEARHAYTVANPSSDHRAVVADLVLKEYEAEDGAQGKGTGDGTGLR